MPLLAQQLEERLGGIAGHHAIGLRRHADERGRPSIAENSPKIRAGGELGIDDLATLGLTLLARTVPARMKKTSVVGSCLAQDMRILLVGPGRAALAMRASSPSLSSSNNEITRRFEDGRACISRSPLRNSFLHCANYH